MASSEHRVSSEASATQASFARPLQDPMALLSLGPDDWEQRHFDASSLDTYTDERLVQHEDDRPSPESPHAPARLSALYQYHNAPEVAPSTGLEYDDTIYPHSDKFPVIRETIFSKHHYTGKHAYENDNSPPRIIFGMKVKTFLIVATIMLLVIVGAAVGGAVGGKNMHQGPSSDGTFTDMSGGHSSSAPTSTATKPATTPTTFVAPTPTYTPLSDCPASNGTTYTSSYADGSQGTVPSSAGLLFTKYCALTSPLTSPTSTQLAEVFVYSFSDCVDLCAGMNFSNGDSNCTVAVYQPKNSRPSNCWVGSADDITPESLEDEPGTDVAWLTQ